MTTFTCIDCKRTLPIHTDGGTGYATFPGGMVCYDCCAIRDQASMKADGVIALYWDGKVVSNWPGTLKLAPSHVRKGRHNMAGTITYVYFRDVDGKPWSGRNVGENTQILHCRRVSERAMR